MTDQTKKYELTTETMEHKGRTLHRIRSLLNFEYVKAGDLGGWIEYEDNLSHDGDCWVYDEAKVFGGAKVFGDAKISASVEVCGKVNIYGETEISGEARIYGEDDC